MIEGYRYKVHGIPNQIACNDNGNWYTRSTGLGNEYLPWVKRGKPVFKNGKLRVNNYMHVNVEPLPAEPNNLPQD
jgi:hypothetical protein